jgi:hypothetical protein
MASCVCRADTELATVDSRRTPFADHFPPLHLLMAKKIHFVHAQLGSRVARQEE